MDSPLPTQTARTQMDKEAVVREIDALYERATRGPWYLLEAPWLHSDCETTILAGSPDPHAGKFVCDFEQFGADDEEEETKNTWNDAEFIVAIVNAWPQIRVLLERDARSLEVYFYEWQRLQAMNDHLIKHLSHIHMLMHPKDTQTEDGRRFKFAPPDALVREAWEGLSKAIREIPQEIDAAKREKE